ncbi:hypothetical protein [Mesorhizobium sp.]|uniref:hypothetical protein n=1 Tax=Mesorhizobium sp. TaxID=1871066 RepID=UPI0025BAEFCE|nr:hypothetical protein [Mesorhizobium sp.]
MLAVLVNDRQLQHANKRGTPDRFPHDCSLCTRISALSLIFVSFGVRRHCPCAGRKPAGPELIKSNEKARNEIAEMDDKEPEEIEEMRDSGERS